MDNVFIKLELTTVHGKLAGDPSAPLVLAIHGWSQRNGWHTWEPLMEPLAVAGYCVVSVDMPGWGDSPALDNLPLGGSRAVQVVIDIMNGLQKSTAILMGKSWGGGVAIKTAVAHPERISKLILTAPALRNLDQLPHIEQPVLLTWAEDDPVIPFAMSEPFISAVPNIEFVAYPSGGHSAAQKNAVDFAAKAIDFLAK
ncbi:MAG: alpha/beta fold hydrolase [Candidatus Promineifilaceae bacterium]|jgi:pimeloyl-ACP methyl ester carboxylesterase